MDYPTELAFLHRTAVRCSENPHGNDGIWQVAPVFASIPYRKAGIEEMRHFANAIRNSLPRLGAHGVKRAAKAFVHKVDTITKPSYINRIQGNGFHSSITQRELLERAFVKEPSSGGLVFSVFDPRDLIMRRRPGYVPCLISGSLLLHRSELHLNAFFRSQSILEFGVYDLMFLREFQRDFLSTIAAIPRSQFPRRSNLPREIRVGPVNLHFARVIVQRRLARQRTSFLRRSATVDSWLRIIMTSMQAETTEGRGLLQANLGRSRLGGSTAGVATLT
jgi:hypothetical protein